MGNAISVARNAFDQSFLITTPALTEKNLPDQSGKVFLITGANSGVGYQVASFLYSRNGTVYVGCRTESKAHDAIASIRKAWPASTGRLEFLKLDLSDLASVRASAEEFTRKETRLDWLDNNAGVMIPPAGSKGKQGHELQYATNILGPFILTKALLPVLKATAESRAQEGGGEKGAVRVSWAGSLAVDLVSPKGGMLFKKNPEGDWVPDDFGGGGNAYGCSKVANWWLANEFGKRFGDRDGVLHDAYNPGNLSSGLQQHLPGLAAWILDLFLFEARFGAYTELYAGLSPDLQLPHDQGKFVIPWGRKTTWNRPDVAANIGEGKGSEKLWDWCEAETKQYQ